ncbi:MAG TPA: acyclic terpene utilization AtuA family protein [Polyangiales bacterium]|nr:acyclic terpene utilization AtuA family protein [Polyangiales bacterium]
MSNVRIGCAAGFWGDTETAAPQLVERGALDYLVLDYLAEITMSIMAGARTRGDGFGYATDFVSRVLRATLRPALEKGVKIVTNAGGVNPLACRDAVLALAAELGVAPKIAVVLGDDLLPQRDALAALETREMYSGASLPPFLLSANAYLGAKPIADALAAGAQIVITGRVVDSALVLGPLVHEHEIAWDDYDRLAQASLAGHVIECGAQCTGGLFTDWQEVPGYDDMGYPIVECAPDGSFVVEKPANTGGLVTPAVVYEQLLYEIGDPRAYVLPDVVCDFSQVHAEQIGPDRVRVSGATGRAPTASYKVSSTYPDGFKLSAGILLAGEDAARKGRRVARALVDKIERLLVARGLGKLRDTQIDVLGAESTYGPHARAQDTREVVVRIAVSHDNRDALKLFGRELPQAGTSMAPGFATLIGGQAQPATMIKLFSFLIDKARVNAELDFDGRREPVAPAQLSFGAAEAVTVPPEPAYPAIASATRVPLIALAYGRSGDKGNHSNIGIIAREARFVPLIGAALTAEAVTRHMAHVLDRERGRVTRYALPGCNGWNFLLENSLGGGGVASLRADPQGKAHAQQLLAFEVPVPAELWKEIANRPLRSVP